MKKIILIPAIFSIIAGILIKQANAQSPEKINFNVVIRNNKNQLVANKQIGIKISILKNSATGPVVYTETQTSLTNINGLAGIEIGSIPSFNYIDWENGPFFLKTETDTLGGTGYTISNTRQILMVPYAIYAQKAKTTSLNNGIRLPNDFDPDFNYVGDNGNFISFGHQGISRDFIGYRNNRFYFKNSGNTDSVDPDIIIGGKIGIGINEPAEKLEVKGNIDIHNSILKNVADPSDTLDIATKGYADSVKNRILAEFGVFDIERNHYKAVVIGTQIWMAENLKTTKLSDGTDIPKESDITDWDKSISPYYCWYDNDKITYGDTYGALYNWYSINTGKLCPAGWHVPTDSEWNSLITFLGGDDVAGGKLKETGTIHWTNPNYGANNETGFTALPGGEYKGHGEYSFQGGYGFWWTATETSLSNAQFKMMNNDSKYIIESYTEKNWGLSVRCIKD